MQYNDGSWRTRKNNEINNLIHGTGIVRFIKRKRIAAGHTMRTEPHRISRKMLEWIPIERSSRRKPRKRWLKDVEEDVRNIKIRRWMEMTTSPNEGAQYREIVEEAKTHAGLYRQTKKSSDFIVQNKRFV